MSDGALGSLPGYAVSVIYARALPDARDGLRNYVRLASCSRWIKMGLRPDKGGT